jgi:type VI secretion system protein ImpG
MRDELLGYYERELIFLRQMGADFAQKYPKIASRLLIEADKCEDPHVERLIEAFSFLAGRVHLKIDDEFPEITESFLNVLYPHYLAPIPAMTIVQFSVGAEKGNLTTGYHVERNTNLYSKPIQGTPCRFRTSFPTTLWPLKIASASLESLDPVDTRGKWAEAAIKISVECLNDTMLSTLRRGDSEKTLESLRFYINGEPQVTYALYEMIFNNATRVELRPLASQKKKTGGLKRPVMQPVVLPTSALKAVGFESDEGMLPYTASSFIGYRLLTEYFAFPQKFLFFDLTGLEQAARAGFGDRFEIVIYLRDVVPPRGKVEAINFQLGCTPAVNLFQELAEPIQLTGKQHEYHVIPDVRRQMEMEVYAVDEVTSTDALAQETRHFQPFYSYAHAKHRDGDPAFWYASRRQSERAEDLGTEVYLSLVDLGFNPHVPASDILNVRVTCSNRDLPGKLPFGGREGDLDVEGAVPISRVHCLTKPTPTLRQSLRRGTQWRLISHLSLNHLSLAGNERDGAPDALQEILSLYDLQDSAATRKQIVGINRVTSRRVVRQTGSRIGSGFVRGIETTVELDEEQYVGSGVFLFASVLERFLGLYASLNSFNQLAARTKQREGVMKQWPPRTGAQILL